MTLLLATACMDHTLTEATRGLAPRGSLKNTAVTGAGFTTVNETVDGTGHCKNGNPAVNCNIYDGKQFVWLNGGPAAASVGDGSYFFVVLSPGGQNNPNDGAADNLSDDFDAYTNRTFSVTGGTISYGGSHDFNSNKIRLAPYADTPNPGGVYIMAICSLADGYPVDPSDCKYDAFKVGESAVIEQGAPTASKTAVGAYDKTYTWQIAKSVDKTSVTQAGGTVTFNYTVNVTHDAGTTSNVKVTGTIAVFDPIVDLSNNVVAVGISGITDALSDGTTCTVTNGGVQSLTLGETDFAYSCTLSALPTGPISNNLTVSWDEQFLTTGALLHAGSAQFSVPNISFTQNAIDECVSVTDTYAGTLGQACVGDANPKSFTYSRTIPVLPGCHSYDNTATFTTNDTGATGSSGQTVTVCGPPATGALTMGFWKGPNGNSLILNYCAPGGKTSLAAYLAGLGAGSGPFADAAGKTCAQLVTYVDGIISGANASNMNTMIRAQMLATALDVYFSTTTLGYSTVGSGSGKNQIKPPSTFLPSTGLGSFKMDLTAICPMVDNTTAGSATCTNTNPSTNGVASGVFPTSPMTIQAILDYASTTPSPFNGSTSNPIWFGGDRTKEEVLKNTFDQFNNSLAFGSF